MRGYEGLLCLWMGCSDIWQAGEYGPSAASSRPIHYSPRFLQCSPYSPTQLSVRQAQFLILAACCSPPLLQVQGPIINFEVLKPDGNVLSYKVKCGSYTSGREEGVKVTVALSFDGHFHGSHTSSSAQPFTHCVAARHSQLFESEAATAGFHVRTGTECNPGACYAYLGAGRGGEGGAEQSATMEPATRT